MGASGSLNFWIFEKICLSKLSTQACKLLIHNNLLYNIYEQENVYDQHQVSVHINMSSHFS